MNTKDLLDPFLGEIKAEIFGPLVEEAMKENFAAPPPNSLEPKKVWESKTKSSLMDDLSGQAAIDKTAAGFDAIVEDLSGQLSSQEMEKISQEWEHGVEVWIQKAQEINTKDEVEGPLPESLQEILGISEETLNHFYHAGLRFFENKEFQKSSDVFYVIAGLDPHRYNVWLNLGLSDAQSERFESALMSFSMASIINAESPFPYIYSAECCLKDNRKDEAKIYLDLAKEIVENGESENKQTLLHSIHSLEQSWKEVKDV